MIVNDDDEKDSTEERRYW